MVTQTQTPFGTAPADPLAAVVLDTAHPVSLFRLYLLRSLYLLVVVGLGIVVWPGVIHRERPFELMEGVVACMLAAFSALCVLGLRHPLRMLPLLVWELLWKTIWLAAVVLPLWRAGRLDEATWSIAVTCLPIAIFPFILPWRYMFDHYLRQRGDRWR